MELNEILHREYKIENKMPETKKKEYKNKSKSMNDQQQAQQETRKKEDLCVRYL